MSIHVFTNFTLVSFNSCVWICKQKIPVESFWFIRGRDETLEDTSIQYDSTNTDLTRLRSLWHADNIATHECTKLEVHISVLLVKENYKPCCEMETLIRKAFVADMNFRLTFHSQ